MEILIPPFFVLFLFAIRSLITKEVVPEKSYLSTINKTFAKDITADPNGVTRSSYKTLNRADMVTYQVYLRS